VKAIVFSIVVTRTRVIILGLILFQCCVSYANNLFG